MLASKNASKQRGELTHRRERQDDPMTVDLCRIQKSHAESGSPSRFPLHKVKLKLTKRLIKSATEIEAEPVNCLTSLNKHKRKDVP